MKKYLLAIALCCVINFAQLSAQTIGSNDLVLPTVEAPLNGVVFTTTGSLEISQGEGQNWDFSDLEHVRDYQFGYTPTEGTDDYPTAQYFRIYNGALGSLVIQNSRSYFSQNAEGQYYLGFSSSEGSYPLTSMTGGQNDKLDIPNYASVFEEPAANYIFPINYGLKHSMSYKGITKYNLSVAMFGLDKTPGEVVQTVTVESEAVGYGTLTTPNYLGQPALLLKITHTYVDSIYLGGQPAPPTLLGAFGLVQGDSWSQVTYEFLISDGVTSFNHPALEVIYSEEETEVISITGNTQPVVNVSVANAAKYNAKLYPIPTTNGIVNLEFEKISSDEWSIELIDLQGNNLQSYSVANAGVVNQSIDLNKVANGLYFAVVKDQSGNIVFSKDFVK